MRSGTESHAELTNLANTDTKNLEPRVVQTGCHADAALLQNGAGRIGLEQSSLPNQ
jgi:hypothetical protein